MSTTSVPITARDGRPLDLDASQLDALGSDLDGSLLKPDDGGYAESVSLWNGMITKRPANDANRSWVRGAWEALKPFSTGGNDINFQTDDEPEDRTRAAFRSNYDRLTAVKARYDPTNLFRVNRNIR